MSQTNKVRSQGLDKFYTIKSIASKCINIVTRYYEWNRWDMVLEPSAGNGSFYKLIPTEKKIGIDISPEHIDIVNHDFFTYNPPPHPCRILVIGNPPFGRVSSLAIKFFNKAATYANVIAFIIPRTFRRVSVQNKLDLHFHLLHDEEIPMKPCSFNPPMSVKCCFQIWEKKDTLRLRVLLPIKHKDWDFIPYGPKDEKNQPTPPEGADFAVRAYGGKCGEITLVNLNTLRPKSWHFIHCNIEKDKLLGVFNKLDFLISLDTARQNSLGKAELVYLYTKFIDSEPK